jgi:signal transduction histidine kinase
MAAKGILLSADIETTARVLGNAIQFEQVLINMINNARDAILANGTSGTIVIEQTLDEGHVIVTIQDSGGGIPADALPHIFEPFYTTKPVGKGTGLGARSATGLFKICRVISGLKTSVVVLRFLFDCRSF